MKHLMLFLTLFLTGFSSYAETPQEKGLAIAKEVELRDRGWGDVSSSIVMIGRRRLE